MIGRLKFAYDRWRGNVGIGQFLLTVYIAITVGNFPLWLMVVLLIASVFYTVFFDLKYILPSENQTSAEKNPVLMEILNHIRYLTNDKTKHRKG